VEMATKFKSPQVIKDELGMAVTKSRVEARYLNLDTEEIELYQDMISHIPSAKTETKMGNEQQKRRLYLSCLTKPMT